MNKQNITKSQTSQTIWDSYQKYTKELERFILVLDKLKQTIGIGSDIDIRTYPMIVAYKLTTMFTTLWNIIIHDKDFCCANIIIRSIADNISSLNLIYQQTIEEEIKILRHNLYLLDDIDTRLENIQPPIKNENIPEEEFGKLLNQQHRFMENLMGAKNVLLNNITQLKLYTSHKQQIEELIKKGHYNWKFISLDIEPSKINNKNNVYTWKKMYSLLDLKGQEYFFSSYQSSYVHGLSLSNITIMPNKENLSILLSIALALMVRLELYIRNYYQSDFERIINNQK